MHESWLNDIDVSDQLTWTTVTLALTVWFFVSASSFLEHDSSYCPLEDLVKALSGQSTAFEIFAF